jgi:uncharacterized protein YukE
MRWQEMLLNDKESWNMATKLSIEFDFNKAMKDADKVENIANELKRLATQKFDDTMQNLAVNWKGDNASRYLKKGEILGENMVKTANDLYNIAAEIRTVARRVYKTELAALEIAQKREY